LLLEALNTFGGACPSFDGHARYLVGFAAQFIAGVDDGASRLQRLQYLPKRAFMGDSLAEMRSSPLVKVVRTGRTFLSSRPGGPAEKLKMQGRNEMSELLAPVGAEQKFEEEQVEQSIESTVGESVLITEQQVLFATAAAVGVEPVRRSWTQVIVAALRAMVTWEPADLRRQRPNDFLESSRMAREMYRL
jgi:hypothetical protein